MEGFEPPSFRSVVGCPIQLGHISFSLSSSRQVVNLTDSRPVASQLQENLPDATVRPTGLEPVTRGLRIPCSAN